jgi:hypothetical protein
MVIKHFIVLKKLKGALANFFICFFSPKLAQQLIRSTAIACNTKIGEVACVADAI